MTQKSRLGKGLGALFPPLPGELNAADTHRGVNGDQDTLDRGRGSRLGDRHASSLDTMNHRSSVQSDEPDAERATGDKATGGKRSDDVSRETSSPAAASKNAADKRAHTRRRARATQSISGKKGDRHRSSIPTLLELAHPSDVFFGATARTDGGVTNSRIANGGAAGTDTMGFDTVDADKLGAGTANTDTVSEDTVHKGTAHMGTANADTKHKSVHTTLNSRADPSNGDATHAVSSLGDGQSAPQSRIGQSAQEPDPEGASQSNALMVEPAVHNPRRHRLSGVDTAVVNDEATRDDASTDTDTLPIVNGGYLAELRISDVVPNAHQPRSIFDEDELNELADSIREVGVLQPIVVRKRPGKTRTGTPDAGGTRYELIMGERRWRASQLAGLDAIPAIVKTTQDDDMLRDALLENLHRVNLNPLEEAAAYQQMIKEFGLTQAALSKAVSKSRPQIANMLRLLNLPGTVQKRVAAGVLSAGHARALLGLNTPDDMDALATRIIAEGLSVRSTEEIVAMKTQPIAATKRGIAKKPDIWRESPVRRHLEDRFETTVSIRGNEKHGKIEIVFSSPEDMERIVGLLIPEHHETDSETASHTDGWI